MSQSTELEQARKLLQAQSELLARYAAALEREVCENPAHSDQLRTRLTERASTARTMASVMFRAATHTDGEPHDRAELPAGRYQ